jgi:hypothetical protein
MNATLRRLVLAVLAACVALGGLASAVEAQGIQPINPNFFVAPGLSLNQAAYNTAVIGRAISQVPPYAFGFNPYQQRAYTTPFNSPVPFASPLAYSGLGGQLGGGMPAGMPQTATLSTNPYGFDSMATTSPAYQGAYSGYPSSYGEDPAAGFLRGQSDVIRATGDYFKDVQTARIYQTKADEGRIDYRRKLIDEANYERGLLPTTEELRQRDLDRDLKRARHQPPVADIISAKSLNDILNHLRSDPTLRKGPNVPIDEDVLKRINVANPTGKNASVGLLKDEGKLQWPAPLAVKEFEAPRLHLSRILINVVQGLKSSVPVEAGQISDLGSDLTQLQGLVEKSELSPSDYIDAKGYLDQVDASVRALKDPNVSNIFNHKFNAKNVAELVDGMKGMDFAPAAPGDEWAYRVLQQALVSYDYAVSPPDSQAQAVPPKQP